MKPCPVPRESSISLHSFWACWQFKSKKQTKISIRQTTVLDSSVLPLDNQRLFRVPHTFLAHFLSWKVEEINWRLVHTCAVTKHLGYLALMVLSRNLPLHTLFCYRTPIELKILVYHPESTFHNDSHEYIPSIIKSQMFLISILLLFLPGVWIPSAYSRGL